MKTTHAAIAAIFLSVLLAGCATPPAKLTPTQIAQRVCAVVQPTITAAIAQAQTVQPPPSADMMKHLTTASTVAMTFCNATATATTQTTQQMLDSAMPVVISAVANSSLPEKTRSGLLITIVAAQTAANMIISQ